MILGLCCLFHDKKLGINFKTYTRKSLEAMSLESRIERIKSVCHHNSKTLQTALSWCHSNNIESFRVSSDVIPHFEYIRTVLSVDDLEDILLDYECIDTYGIVLSIHPGQFVNPGSPNSSVVETSLMELSYHRILAEHLGINEINIHLGGAYGDPESAKKRFITVLTRPENIPLLDYLTIENDELAYSVEDCLEVANVLGIPVTMDLHHHRCMELHRPSKYTERELFEMCRETWKELEYQRVHISSPRDGYTTPSKSRPHSDLINPSDIPTWILEYPNVHIDVEAKFKEVAIECLLEAFPETRII